MPLAELSRILWRERDLLDLLLFKLEEEQLLFEAGSSRWLGRAGREVTMVRQEIQRAELSRAVQVDLVRSTLALPAGTCLGELADAAPAPWGDVLHEHRTAMSAASREIAELRRTHRHPVIEIDRPLSVVGVHWPESNGRAAGNTTRRAVHPSLRDFLR